MDKVELNGLTYLIRDQIREFPLNRFEEDVEKANGDGSFWKLTIIIKASRSTDNSPIQGRNEVIFDARGNTSVLAECTEDQFSPKETDISFRSH